ncbi:DUF4342 domain-containing protein [Heliorestis acidaminivorans]|uniref:DUF4342 domain-containing protein n=1 Tax=Heliorestis acidaminivorans TaxID=553427 RepID=A0A6I0EW41_9FIRM|nr:DUF4342 domain-containing protein [Heliorestis acidaminivorans]KAB2952275.1 DUF4342 domain-containing protein [Heliorestis acidaminivorans]
MDQYTTLEKIDLIRSRMGVSYKEALEALDYCNGDVVEALVYLENRSEQEGNWRFQSQKWWKQLKELIQEGNVRSVRLVKDDKILVKIPITIGVLGVAGALLSTQLALLAALGTITAVATGCKLEVERKDGSVDWINIDREDRDIR